MNDNYFTESFAHHRYEIMTSNNREIPGKSFLSGLHITTIKTCLETTGNSLLSIESY